VLDREEQLRQGLLEAPTAEMRNAHVERQAANPGPRIEARRGFEMLDCDLGLTRPHPEGAADAPGAREIRVQRQCTIDERCHSPDVFAEIGQR
jgi:hypothetical protein